MMKFFLVRHDRALLCILILLGVASTGLGWAYHRPLLHAYPGQRSSSNCRGTFLCNAPLDTPGDKNDKGGPSTVLNDDGDDDSSSSGFNPFGDITRSVLGKFQSGINSLTGKSSYEFGDLSNWLDSQAKEGAVKLDQSVKQQVQKYTQRPDYQFGDITKEVIRRFQDGEYSAEDLWLFLRIMLVLGKVVLPPVAASLPVKVLMELVELSMAQSVSQEVTGILTNEVDQRMKQFFVGDKAYQLGVGLGDMTKKMLVEKGHVVGEVAKHAGGKISEKDVFEFGDLTSKLWERFTARSEDQKKGNDETSNSASNPTGDTSSVLSTMGESALDAFEAWDKQSLAAHNKADEHSSDKYFQQWDEALLAANRQGDSTATLKQRQIEDATSS
jgi:hypothetical protein